MYNRLVIAGAGGHGKVVADIAVKIGYRDILFVDDNATGACIGFPIVGKSCDLEKFYDGRTDFVIAVGNNKVRKEIAEAHDVKWVSLVHPSAQIGLQVCIGAGTVVMAGAVINSAASIGHHCIINTCAVIEHDDIIDDYVHVSPNATLGGTVHVGICTHVGIGATLKNNIDICGGCKIGAGTVVVKTIGKAGTYVGIPAVEVAAKKV